MTLYIVNPNAGGGRCGRQVDHVLARLKERGLKFHVVWTKRPGHATQLARAAYRQGERRFVAVGGDGTAFEVVNGIMPAPDRATLGFLPLGTGNSFLRDFTERGVDHCVDTLAAGQTRACDLIRIHHDDGILYSINLVCLGFPADVASVTNRRFKFLGRFGYVLGVLAKLARLPRPVIAYDGHRERCLYVTFANSKYTGGTMMIAPRADPSDGLIELVHVRPMGRLRLLRVFPRIFKGTFLELPEVERRGVKRVGFDLDGAMDVMIDGEVFTLRCTALECVPHALDVIV